MHSIVVTTDLSKESEQAFGIARKLASAFKAKIHLVSVIEDLAQSAMLFALEYPVFPDVEVKQQFKQKVEEDLQELAKKSFADVEIECHVISADKPVHLEIIEQANKLKADVIVTASKGRSGLATLIMGSVAERIIRHSKIPVLIVPCEHQTNK